MCFVSFHTNFSIRALSSSSQFVKLSLTLSYSDVPVQGTDENILRQAMHEHILNGEIEIGAEKLGTLLLLRNKFLKGSDNGVKDRCLTTKNKNTVLSTMTEEFEMFVY